jgi:hypothetical protein
LGYLQYVGAAIIGWVLVLGDCGAYVGTAVGAVKAADISLYGTFQVSAVEDRRFQTHIEASNASPQRGHIWSHWLGVLSETYAGVSELGSCLFAV